MNAVMLTNTEAERYELKSVSRHQDKRYYFSTFVAKGLPTLMVTVRYVKRTYPDLKHPDGFYKLVEVRQDSDKVPVRYEIEAIFGRKLDDVIIGTGDLVKNEIKKMGEL